MAIFLTKIPIKFFEESRKDSVMIFISTSGILQKSYEISSWNSARKSTFYKKWFWLRGIEKSLLELDDISRIHQ